jgi:hypothetical protein
MVTEFIHYLELVTTCNYSAIANSHTLKFPSALIKFSVCCVFTSRCLVTASNAVASSASVFTPLLVDDCLENTYC